jgi:secondary thiamine-phosphate synthase enzyme
MIGEIMEKFTVHTTDRTDMINITDKVRSAVQKSGIKNGLACVFIPHTTAAVTINESADPDVVADMLMELNKVIPFQDRYRHMEGNSAAHIKTSVIGTSETIFVDNGELQLGTWQGIFLCEFDGPRTRQMWVKTIPAE